MKEVEVKVKIPQNVDQLIQAFCKLDGGDVTEFYQNTLLEGIAGYLNCDTLLDTEGLARIHGLHILAGLDESIYGKYPEAKAEK